MGVGSIVVVVVVSNLSPKEFVQILESFHPTNRENKLEPQHALCALVVHAFIRSFHHIRQSKIVSSCSPLMLGSTPSAQPTRDNSFVWHIVL